MTTEQEIELGDLLENHHKELGRVFGHDMVDSLAIWDYAEKNWDEFIHKLMDYVKTEDTSDKFYEAVSSGFDIWDRKD